VPPGQPALKATSLATFNDNALMFSYWDPPASLAGRPLILVAREREDLATGKLGAKFTALDEAIHPLALGNTRPGGSGRHIDTYYYRIGYGFQP
jgi:hypothetical protein